MPIGDILAGAGMIAGAILFWVILAVLFGLGDNNKH